MRSLLAATLSLAECANKTRLLSNFMHNIAVWDKPVENLTVLDLQQLTTQTNIGTKCIRYLVLNIPELQQPGILRKFKLSLTQDNDQIEFWHTIKHIENEIKQHLDQVQGLRLHKANLLKHFYSKRSA